MFEALVILLLLGLALCVGFVFALHQRIVRIEKILGTVEQCDDIYGESGVPMARANTAEGASWTAMPSDHPN